MDQWREYGSSPERSRRPWKSSMSSSAGRRPMGSLRTLDTPATRRSSCCCAFDGAGARDAIHGGSPRWESSIAFWLNKGASMEVSIDQFVLGAFVSAGFRRVLHLGRSTSQNILLDHRMKQTRNKAFNTQTCSVFTFKDAPLGRSGRPRLLRHDNCGNELAAQRFC